MVYHEEIEPGILQKTREMEFYGNVVQWLRISIIKWARAKYSTQKHYLKVSAHQKNTHAF